MKFYLYIAAFLFSLSSYGQDDGLVKNDKPRKSLLSKTEIPKAPIEQYKIVSIDRDTTFVDTSLTIKTEYKFNYLRKDLFGLLPFPNEGQYYTQLDYCLKNQIPYPEMGYRAKHYNYIEADEVNYYQVATPLTELYFKTVMEQGQSLNAWIALNTSKQLNLSIGYRGIRSQGKYGNSLTSSGNFNGTASYMSKNKRYFANAHFTGQDLANNENGGVVNLIDFENQDPDFRDRTRLQVYLTDAKNFLKGNRFFIDHAYKIFPASNANNLNISHRLYYESKFFEFNQQNVFTNFGNTTIKRFGTGDVFQINDQLRYNKYFNRVAVDFSNSTLGRVGFLVEEFGYNYNYDKIFVEIDGIIPSSLHDDIVSAGAFYEYRKGKWQGRIEYVNSVSDQSLTNITAKVKYAYSDDISIIAEAQKINKIPDNIYTLHQSSYDSYNWFNNFKNEKTSELKFSANTKWLNVSAQYSLLDDHLYFANDGNDTIQRIAPKQFDGTINYLSVKASREFRWWKLALDNTVLYQKVDQSTPVLNLPDLTIRNTLYFSNYFFKRALYLQSGVTLNYFTSFYADGYNPIIADYYVQQSQKIGDFPRLDFFINARVRSARIFLKAEHFNSAWSGKNKFYSAPNTPYNDFIVRFGLVWTFFQ